MASIRRKLLIIGDCDVGKTCLFTSYTKKEFPVAYVPRVFEGYVASIAVDGGLNCEMAFWDTVGNSM